MWRYAWRVCCRFRLGVFSSAKSYNIKNAIKSIFMAVCQGRKEVDTEQVG
jgi:hypothetical protein